MPDRDPPVMVARFPRVRLEVALPWRRSGAGWAAILKGTRGGRLDVRTTMPRIREGQLVSMEVMRSRRRRPSGRVETHAYVVLRRPDRRGGLHRFRAVVLQTGLPVPPWPWHRALRANGHVICYHLTAQGGEE